MSSPTLQPDQTGFYTQTRVAKKILVVDLGFLGDTLHLVPALWEIKRHYPLSALHVLTSPLGAEVLRLAPCADRAWAIELYPGKRTLASNGRLCARCAANGLIWPSTSAAQIEPFS